MTIKKMKKEELETMSYNDIANLLLNEENKQTTADLFKEIVNLLELSQSTYESKIGNFYTAMANDKRFTLLEDGTWDLRKNHKSNIILDDDIEDYEETIEEVYDDIESYDDDIEENIYEEETEDDVVDATEEYKNLVIIDEEDLNNND